MFVFVGGGTGGHLFPGIAVAEGLQQRLPECQCLFVVTGRSVELETLAQSPYHSTQIPPIRTVDLKRRPWRFVKDFWRATRRCRRLMRGNRPAAIIGLGGVASVPLVRIAGRTPVFLLEQNVLPGRTTRWLAKKHKVLMSFEKTREWLPNPDRHVVTGNPLRNSILRQRSLITEAPPIGQDGKKTLLVLGGSLGSAEVNRAVETIVRRQPNDFTGWRIWHQAGPQANELESARTGYQAARIEHEVAPFFDDLPGRLAQTDLAISRAGATTLAELAAAAIPSVLIPFSAAKDDHQTWNARYYADAGAALRVDIHAAETIEQQLQRQLIPLLCTDETRERMIRAARKIAMPQATDCVVDEILRTVENS